MRRIVLVTLLLMIAPTACSVRTSDAAEVPASKPRADFVACEMTYDTTNSNRCSNLLPVGWRTAKGAQLIALGLQIRGMLRGPQDALTQGRRISADCKNDEPLPSEQIVVDYEVAEALNSMPETGTAGGDVLFGVMRERSNLPKCWSSKYSVQSTMGPKPRALTFMTVQTVNAPHIDGVDRQVGRWTSWTIRGSGNDASLVQTGTGAFVSCGHTHFVSEPAVKHAFINCESVRQLMDIARVRAKSDDQSVIAGEFDRLMQTYRSGGRIEGLRADPTTDSAWGRCGALGCCAAE